MIRPRAATAATAAAFPKSARCACGESRLPNDRRDIAASAQPDARPSAASRRLPAPKFTPEELSALLGEKNSPTAEQSHIISSPLSPRLVIAGAGSGKTATMADRVVWLVANGWVRPEEVLGVTFTRKAAGELATRIRAKLAALQRIAAADTQNQVFPAGLLSTDALEPKVSTYHSYASGIVSDYGLRLGVERDVVLLGGAQSWQLASEVVEAFDGDYEHFRSAKSTLVKAVIQLAGECAEHLQDPAGVRGWLLDRVAEFESLPYLATAKKNPSQAVGELSGLLRTRASVAEMVGRYTDAKRARGALDFGDLVALAAARRQRGPGRRGHRTPALQGGAARRVPGHLARPAGALFPAVRRRPRGDRGGGPQPVDLRLPRRLRRPALPLRPRIPGAAPGDGAADGRRCALCRAPTSYLTTAWRNGRTILAAANVISAPLSRAAARTGPAGERDTAGGSRFRRCSPARQRSRAAW